MPPASRTSRPARSARRPAIAILGLALALPGRAAAAEPVTPNAIYQRGLPTFVVGTAGDDRADREIAAQASLIRGMLFPAAKIVPDTSIEVAKGPSAWPANPVLYGGPEENAVLAALAGSLPFGIGRGRLALGGETFTGDEYRLIAAVPATGAGTSPGWPDFLVYAGTGGPGIAEINALRHGPHPILVADAFGALRVGTWTTGADGRAAATFPVAAARRIPWRAVERAVATPKAGAPGTATILFPEQVPATDADARVADACARGLGTALRRLRIERPVPLRIHVYPDRASKRSLTGVDGDGLAVAAARVLHVVAADAAPGGALESLVAHEGTHVLAQAEWGSAGSALLGEGLAVWAAGQYGGRPLAEWAKDLRPDMPAPSALIGADFRSLAEGEAYPVAGLFVDAAAATIGIEKVARHLLGATSTDWDAACRRAGTTPAALDAAFAARLPKAAR